MHNQIWCDVFQCGVQKLKCMLPVVDAGDADGGMGVAMRHGDGNGGNASQGTLDRARVRSSTRWSADLIRALCRFCRLTHDASQPRVVQSGGVCHRDGGTESKLCDVAYILTAIMQA